MIHSSNTHAKMSATSLIYGLVLSVLSATVIQAAENKSPSESAETVAKADSNEATTEDKERANNENIIVITATKRGLVSSQDVASSITAFDENKLERLDALDFDDFIVHVPGTNFISNGGPGRGNEIASIRGISPVADNTRGVVAQYLDGAPRFGENYRLFDIGEVSVLRGPQGTLWGAQSMGGLISYRSNRPNMEGFDGQLEADYYSTKSGGGASYRVGGYVNIPLIDNTFAIRVAGHFIDEKGYVDNVTTGVNDINSVDEDAWRISALYTPTDELSFTFIYHGNDLTSNAPTFYDLDLGNFEIAEPFTDSPATQEYDLLNFIVDADLGWATFSYNASYFEQERLVVDFATNIFGFIPLGRTDSPDERESWTHELKLASTGDSDFQWIAGIYYDDLETNDPARQIQIDASGVPTSVPAFEISVIGGREDISEIAIYGEGEYSFNDELSLLLGVRYFDWEVDNQEEFTFFGSNFQQETGKVGGDDFFFKTQVNYKPNSDLLFYGIRSEGFRFGGFNPFVGAALNIPDEFVGFDPDTLTNYEIGMKSVWQQGKLIFNTSAYFMEWDEIQTVVFNDDASFAFTTNGPDLEAEGIELELITNNLIADGFYLAASFAYTDNEFQDDARIFPGTPALIEKGESLRRTPRRTWSFDVGYDFEFNGEFDAYVRMNYWYKAATTTEGFNGNDGAVAVPSQKVANFSTGLDGTNWRFKLYVDNLTDKTPFLQVFPAASAGGLGGDTATRVSTIRPRTIGLEVTYKFSN